MKFEIKKEFTSDSKMSLGGKQRLRPWLEDMITRGEINGLCWMNEEKTKFKIPWKHGGKQDWTPENSRIFMEWANHTGKFRKGVDSEDYPMWKTRLRCAFNKAPYIKEVKDESQLEGPEPFRVYVLSPSTKRLRSARKSLDSHLSMKRETKDGCRDQTASDMNASAGPLVPTTVTDIENDASTVSTPDTESLPFDLENIDGGDFPQVSLMDMDCGVQLLDSIVIQEPFDTIEETFPNETFLCSTYSSPCCPNQEITGSSVCDSYDVNEESPKFNGITCYQKDSDKLELKVYYWGQMVLETTVMDSIYLVKSDANEKCLKLPDQIPEDIELVQLPSCQSHHHAKDQYVDRLIAEGFEDGTGVLLWCEDGDLFAYRSCRCAIYYKLAVDSTPVKIVYQQKTLIFNNDEYFKTMKNHPGEQSSLQTLDPIVYLTFAQLDANGSLKNTCVYATIATKRALAATKNAVEGVEHQQFITIRHCQEQDLLSPSDYLAVYSPGNSGTNAMVIWNSEKTSENSFS